MIISLLRIPLTLAFAYSLYRAVTKNPDVNGGEMMFLMGYGLFGAIAVAILWAPVIGEKVSDPIISTLTEDTSLPPVSNLLVRGIYRCQRRGSHRLALLLVFMEGIRKPTLPQPALLGLRSVRPGSFLEKCFAKEVYKYNNIQNCVHAYTILKERHGIAPPPHKHPEVNLAIMNLNREKPGEPAKLQLKPSQQASLPGRNYRIKLFRP